MSDAVARPVGFNGFVVRERYTRVHCDAPGYEELWAEVRTNLIHAERDAFVTELQRIDQEAVDRLESFRARYTALAENVANAKDDEARAQAIAERDAFMAAEIKAAAETRRKRFALVAPYVRAWNVYDDEYRPVPPPKDDLDAAMAWTDDTIVQFLIKTCAEAYKGGKGLRPSSSASAPTPEPGSEPPSGSETAPNT